MQAYRRRCEPIFRSFNHALAASCFIKEDVQTRPAERINEFLSTNIGEGFFVDLGPSPQPLPRIDQLVFLFEKLEEQRKNGLTDKRVDAVLERAGALKKENQRFREVSLLLPLVKDEKNPCLFYWFDPGLRELTLDFIEELLDFLERNRGKMEEARLKDQEEIRRFDFEVKQKKWVKKLQELAESILSIRRRISVFEKGVERDETIIAVLEREIEEFQATANRLVTQLSQTKGWFTSRKTHEKQCEELVLRAKTEFLKNSESIKNKQDVKTEKFEEGEQTPAGVVETPESEKVFEEKKEEMVGETRRLNLEEERLEEKRRNSKSRKRELEQKHEQIFQEIMSCLNREGDLIGIARGLRRIS